MERKTSTCLAHMLFLTEHCVMTHMQGHLNKVKDKSHRKFSTETENFTLNVRVLDV